MERERKNRRLEGPRAVRRSVSFPQDVAEALDEEVERDDRHNFSLLVVEAVLAWLKRIRDPRPA
jgi:Arc/MetJ-type ribon-helix-helix transcriptional regulator